MTSINCRALVSPRRLMLVKVLCSALLVSLVSHSAEAFGRFAGGGAHFNIGGHFNAVRPIGAGGFRPEFQRPGGIRPDPERFPNVHPYPPYRHYYPHYWPYPGPGYWAGAAVGAAAVGSWIYALPPDCGSVTVGGVTYEQCGPNWYRPHYTGTQIAYETVAAPR